MLHLIFIYLTDHAYCFYPPARSAVAAGPCGVVVAADFLTAWYEAGRHSDKLWLHRCNTTAKWLEKRGKFAHFEVDVRFTPEAGSMLPMSRFLHRPRAGALFPPHRA